MTNVLVLNCGTRSVRLSLFEQNMTTEPLRIRASILISSIGSHNAQIECNGVSKPADVPTHQEAIWLALRALDTTGFDSSQVSAVGHRVINGGELTEPCLITPSVRSQLESNASSLSSYSDANLDAIEAITEFLPGCPQVAVFDTSFHATIPKRASRYILSEGVLRGIPATHIGFHGISHQQISRDVAVQLGRSIEETRIISCHLGSVSSVAAIQAGICIDSNIAVRQLDGLLTTAHTESHDSGISLNTPKNREARIIDPGKAQHRRRDLMALAESNDISDILEGAALGDRNCKNAIESYVYCIRKYIGAYIAAMGGVDAIAFTGGIGENSSSIRAKSVQGFDFIDLRISTERNSKVTLDLASPIKRISENQSEVTVFVANCDEAHSIAQASYRVLGSSECLRRTAVGAIPIKISERHVHLTEKAISKLFGERYDPKLECEIAHSSHLKAHKRVTIAGPKGEIHDVNVIEPKRDKNQVELSSDDVNTLGFTGSVHSPDQQNASSEILLIGPKGKLELDPTAIQPLRHVHMHSGDAVRFNVSNNERVSINVQLGPHSLTFHNVQVRVDDSFKLELHLDSSEVDALKTKQRCHAVLIR